MPLRNKTEKIKHNGDLLSSAPEMLIEQYSRHIKTMPYNSATVEFRTFSSFLFSSTELGSGRQECETPARFVIDQCLATSVMMATMDIMHWGK